MSVIVLGDQGVGKTTLMLELARVKTGKVQVLSPSWEDLKTKFTLNELILPTEKSHNTSLKIKVDLSGNFNEFDVNWIDTPGEAWRPNSPWQKDNPREWREILQNLQEAKAVMIILAPHQSLLKDNLLIEDGKIAKKDYRFRTVKQWKNRFQEWLSFLKKNCPNVMLVAFCLNMADLFCDIYQYSQALENLSIIKWYEYKTEMLPKFFSEVMDLIDLYDEDRRLDSHVFVTTYKNRTLLEFPWRYFGLYL